MPEEIRQLKPLQDVIKDHVLAALEACGGHVVKTAGVLHLSPKTVYNMLGRWRIPTPRRKLQDSKKSQESNLQESPKTSKIDEPTREDVTEFLETTGLKKPSLKRARIHTKKEVDRPAHTPKRR